MASERISAFVVSFNRAPIIGTCLRSLRFADEVIVVDKSSTDATPEIAAALADRLITVPWSPTVEETRGFAAEQCTHDWILFLDDDECLSPETASILPALLAAPEVDAYALPQRHYILGRHDERAYYWPEFQLRCFRRGSVTFGDTVHAGLELRSERVRQVGPETGVCIHNLSHSDTAQWLEKTNRYTSRPDRVRVAHAGQDLAGFAHARIDHWLARTRDREPGGYPSAVALLRAVYDIIDRLKVWEQENGLDGTACFRQVCAALDAAYGPAPQRCAERAVGDVPVADPLDTVTLLRRSLNELRIQHDEQVARLEQELTGLRAHVMLAETARQEAEAARCAAETAASGAEIRAEQALAALRAMQASTFWRATAWPRRAVDRLQR